MAKIYLLTGMLFFAVLMNGCVRYESTVIKGEDKNVLFPSFRMSNNFLPSTSKKIFGLDFAASRGYGRSSQKLDASDHVDLGYTDFKGPATVKSKYEISTLSAAVRWGFSVAERVKFEWIGGYGATVMDIELTSGSLFEDEYHETYGPILGTEISVKLLSSLQLYARWRQTGSGMIYSEATLSEYELGTSVHIMSHLSLFGGYRTWVYEWDNNSGSDIELELSGPVAGILLTF